jgi:TfoX/Sxy family transcriptional regulator of competence genes
MDASAIPFGGAAASRYRPQEALMKFTKPPQDMVDTFEAIVPKSGAEPRKMFGYPAAFVNGNMFMGLFQDKMMLRLGDDARHELLTLDGAAIFEPMPGRPMREYVVVPRSLLSNRSELSSWISRSLKYAASLPAKGRKSGSAESSTPKRSKAGPKKTGAKSSRRKGRG